MQCPRRWRTNSLLHNAGVAGCGQEHQDHRRTRSERFASVAAGVDRGRRSSVRLLPERTDHGGCVTAGEDAASVRQRNYRVHGGEYLPLWYLRAHPASNPSRCERRRHKVNSLSRRAFLGTSAAAGAGLVIGFCLPSRGQGQIEGTFSPNAYLRIAPDGKVTIVVARTEMGQGVWTSLPMILAEELEADWKQIEIEQAGASTLYGDQTTGGSASIRTTWDPMRKAGAAAREMLISAAALTWGVPRSTCTTENSDVKHAATNRSLSYGELAGKASTLPIPSDVPLKQSKDYKIVGQRLARVDSPAKVKGEAIFGIDLRVPQMKYAVLSRCPTIGGKVSAFDKQPPKVSEVSYVGQISDSSVAIVADS